MKDRPEKEAVEMANSVTKENAFPFILKIGHESGYVDAFRSGLTKRELFAAMAMQGMLAGESESYNFGHIGSLAEQAVKRADALIKELNK